MKIAWGIMLIPIILAIAQTVSEQGTPKFNASETAWYQWLVR